MLATFAAENIPQGTLKEMQKSLQVLLRETKKVDPSLLAHLYIDSGWVWVCDPSLLGKELSPDRKAELSALGFVRSSRGHMMPDGKTVGSWGRPFSGPLLSAVRRGGKPTRDGLPGKSEGTPSESLTLDEEPHGEPVSKEAQIDDIEYGGRMQRIAAEMSNNFSRYGWTPSAVRDELAATSAAAPGLVAAALEGRFLTFAGATAERVATILGMTNELVYTPGRVRLCLLRSSADKEFPDLSKLGIYPVLVGTALKLDQVEERPQPGAETPAEADPEAFDPRTTGWLPEAADDIGRSKGSVAPRADVRPNTSSAQVPELMDPPVRPKSTGSPEM